MKDYYRIQSLLDQAAGCIDAALVEVAKQRDELMGMHGLSAYSVGTCLNRLAESSGTLATVRRMLPGWNVELVDADDLLKT